MIWFGFGFNGFEQIRSSNESSMKPPSDEDVEVKVITPLRLSTVCSSGEENLHLVGASWSRTAFLRRAGDFSVCLFGFRSFPPSCNEHICFPLNNGCLDAQISERYLTLAYKDRTECWSLDATDSKLVWRMKHAPEECTGVPYRLPLVPGGYVVSAPPFLKVLSPHLRGVSLALGVEHAVLLSASGAVYTWGSGSHGQLGHGELGREADPRIVEALWGVAVKLVAAGGWHSVCISDGMACDDSLKVFGAWTQQRDFAVEEPLGWNESGQLGLPSHAVQREMLLGGDAGDTESDSKDVFISIQALPALLDLPEEAEITQGTTLCGSRTRQQSPLQVISIHGDGVNTDSLAIRRPKA
ncbi:hypothetical protein GJAV_G00235870 [Gymnothorax javanicus]|nr:hypothetical protein GJAV_G00235870 [Gymnothorax javanicus]